MGIHGKDTMTQRSDYRAGRFAAVGALLAGATVWGLIWYPYRKLELASLSGSMATTLTYAVALCFGIALYCRQCGSMIVAVSLFAAKIER